MGQGDKMFRGAAWNAFGSISIQAVQFILGIILARILGPKVYGALTILVIFTTISQVFIDSGFTKALIQKKNRSEDDVSTVFLFNIAIAVVCYIVIWFIAPFVAAFYDNSALTLLLRVLSLSLFLNALFTVPTTLYTIDLNFKVITKINFISALISGTVAVIMAASGFGVWSLVWQALLKGLLTTLLMWYWLRWKPNLVFSKKSFKEMFSFGSKLLISSLLGTFTTQMNALLIGKYISQKDLGLYQQGMQFTNVVFNLVTSALNGVLLPGLSPLQDQRDKLVFQTKKIIKSSAIVVVPIFLGLATMAEPIIRISIGEQWLLSIPIMQAFCIGRMITIISGINVNLLYVLGRTDLVLKQQYVSIAIKIALLLAALPFGIVYIALAEVVATSIHFFINTYYPGKLMNFGALQQLKDLRKVVFAGIVMVVPLILINLWIPYDWLRLVLAGIIAPVLYYFMVRTLNISELLELQKKAQSFLKKS
ncbi:lipopolysaccharide biosynthesis protein [Maribacter sp. 2-571]|uniref:lipopolysaccharide biosynthesis protein n=1 Tax=Maribacter sp. 2-571 TaxID=3417569 RepID=UPI003D3581E5